MAKALFFYILIQLFIIIFAVISLLVWDKRYKKNHGSDVPVGFEKTEEIIVDPNNGKRFRIYYNPNTGERFYHEEHNR
ncbi:hypothetical protein [Clostridium pasteurianum]|uniref:Uncharacterized protein n=1 Tax=Clostridium pasteurianum BC1 TaxID=86416 RepID=R4KB24_CLOPA|nr:hypothetical protein [Clostridium pasteurianum]AGK96835.1 hypothetical protein Clopa_1938 [Clostridium pasteurianum BC1]